MSLDSTEIETMHDVFSDWERRAILYYLQEHGGRATVDELCRHLVGWWRGRERPAPRDDDLVRRVREQVACTHLLKLQNFGVVSYDPRRETIRLSEEMKVSVSEPWTNPPAEDTAPTRLLGEAPEA
ncbi:DUF7344 domain-containing protein [Halosimplex salinum]|uniref:DUF7344 domain-containing protein n=1 Tax=Halosimplex salinum TaxID=1710538 RepID=UPI000F4AD02F|nr:hypothetical protein [Halosimplex salinum]